MEGFNNQNGNININKDFSNVFRKIYTCVFLSNPKLWNHGLEIESENGPNYH